MHKADAETELLEIKERIENAFDEDSLYNAYGDLISVVEAQPALAKDALHVFTTVVQSDKSDGRSLYHAFGFLRFFIEAQPSLAKEAFQVFATVVQSDKNDMDSLCRASDVLTTVVQTQPVLVKDVLHVVATALRSAKNDRDVLCFASWGLKDVIKYQPALATSVPSDATYYDGQYAPYGLFVSVTKDQPDLLKEAFQVFTTAVRSDKNEVTSLNDAYKVLASVIKAHPDLSKEAFQVFTTAVRSDKNSVSSLSEAYKILESVVKAQPDLAKDVLQVLATAVQSDKNNEFNLYRAYATLASVIKAQPSLAKEVFQVLATAVRSDKNSEFSLSEAYATLASVIKAQPALAKDVLQVQATAVQSDKNDVSSLSDAYKVLASVIKAQPDLAKDVAVVALNIRGNFEKEKIDVLASCIKHCRQEDFSGLNGENQTIINAAYSLRYSTPEEKKYFLDNMNVDKIAQTSFSAQQRCMNVLISELGKENGLSKEEVLGYRKEESPVYRDNADWLVPASLKGAEIFGCYFPGYIKQAEKHLSIHDSVYWLPDAMDKQKNSSFVSFVQRNLIYDANGERCCRDLSGMEMIGKIWKHLEPEQEKLKYNDILAICCSRKYANPKYKNFAGEAAKFGVSVEKYKDYEDIYQAGLKVPEPFDSSKKFEFGNYCGRFLPREDARVGFFGGYTNCCQHFGGVGRACAVSTVKDPYSQLFVIEDKNGRIVAGSWVWENKSGTYREACFDNIEAIGEFAEHPMVNRIYDMAGCYLTKEANCRRVTIGTGYQDADISGYKKTAAIGLPEQYNNGYSDAKRAQVLLAENPEAKPLDKNQESQRFVRDACFLDWNAMNKVSEQCFPDGDQRLQSPERLTGLALVDEDKGVVGYCLYDKEKRSVYDIAVLPEYQTDKNASSRRLFAEVVKQIKDIGGEWHAEMRDKTSFRYLEAMAQRGLVSFEKHGVDQTMSDGRQVFNVGFKVNEGKQNVKAVMPKSRER